MILSVSRRTDIPAFYSDWFYNRVNEGFVYVRNPVNMHNISKVPVNPEVVDCIVFWTKDPKTMMARLDEINAFNYYFQFTINPYDKRLELNVPNKKSVINTFVELADRIGSNRVIWRYDPILLSNNINIEYHLKYFEEIAKRLSGHTKRCVISFIDFYKKTERNLNDSSARELTDEEIILITKELVQIASKYDIKIQTCSEKINLECYGAGHGKCIDDEIVGQLLGYKIEATKDKNQRKECGCIQSIDIGEYNTCDHGCLYCYANYNQETVHRKMEKHDPNSPLLIGQVGNDDKIKDRVVCPLRRKDITIPF